MLCSKACVDSTQTCQGNSSVSETQGIREDVKSRQIPNLSDLTTSIVTRGERVLSVNVLRELVPEYILT